jgi:transposase
LIEPSRIFPKEDRELRTLTRARESLIKNKSQLKNRIHQALESSWVKLSSVLSDIFGKSGVRILNGLLEGISIDDILKGIKSHWITKKETLLRDAIKNKLDPAQIILIKNSLELMDSIQRKVDELDREIMSRIEKRKEDLEIALSMPGMGAKSAPSILAEIGNYRDFRTPEQLAAWCGLVSSVYQSADKLVTGRITKQGSKYIRSMLVEVAYAASRTRNSKLQGFFLRIQKKSGTKKAVIALARKVLCILYHLLINKEIYQEDGRGMSVHRRENTAFSTANISVDEMIKLLAKAGYEVRPNRLGLGEL